MHLSQRIAETRAWRRYDIRLPAMLMSEGLSLSGETVNISAGGVLFETWSTISGSVTDTFNLIRIGDLGQYACRVVLRRDRFFHIAFQRPARPEGPLMQLLARQVDGDLARF
jgi:hypothetical protein